MLEKQNSSVKERKLKILNIILIYTHEQTHNRRRQPAQLVFLRQKDELT